MVTFALVSQMMWKNTNEVQNCRIFLIISSLGFGFEDTARLHNQMEPGSRISDLRVSRFEKTNTVSTFSSSHIEQIREDA